MLYYHFKKSPNKVDKLENIQKLLEEPSLRYREVHQVRWLSFYEALDAVYRTLDSLITYLTSVSNSDPAAAGIKKRVGQELFISITYSMMDILQPIMKLCLVFQKQDLDIVLVQVCYPILCYCNVKLRFRSLICSWKIIFLSAYSRRVSYLI